uniref:Uncharacterized protein n=1 Tax=Rhizophora mucronata TaxID=61149 RepID=A0A2P2N6H7_RHIMU
MISWAKGTFLFSSSNWSSDILN